MGVGLPLKPTRRGVVFFHFGYSYALRLLVCIYTLRKYYSGPVTVFLRDDGAGRDLVAPLTRLRVNVEMKQGLSRSFDRHKVFFESPYQTTLSIDTDTIFKGPIDELWEPLEREGLLLTRFHAEPYGIDGTPEWPGFGSRAAHLDAIKSLLKKEDYEVARERLIGRGIDINIGVIGVSRPQGDGFLLDWAEHLERGRDLKAYIMDEMLTVGLYGKYRHALMDEKWNCPADEYFRATNLADAKVIHYFSDGHSTHGKRLGRNAGNWSGRKWNEAYLEARQHIDLEPWRRYDPYYFGPLKRFAVFCMKFPADFKWTLSRLRQLIQ